jgi:hypothetical protein
MRGKLAPIVRCHRCNCAARRTQGPPVQPGAIPPQKGGHHWVGGCSPHQCLLNWGGTVRRYCTYFLEWGRDPHRGITGYLLLDRCQALPDVDWARAVVLDEYGWGWKATPGIPWTRCTSVWRYGGTVATQHTIMMILYGVFRPVAGPPSPGCLRTDAAALPSRLFHSSLRHRKRRKRKGERGQGTGVPPEYMESGEDMDGSSWKRK